MPDYFNPLTKKTTRRGFLRGLGGFLANHWLLTALPMGGASMLAWSEYDTLNLKLEKWDLYYPALPAQLEGKTIVQLSDLHLESLQITPEHISKTITPLKPDLIVITGDVINTRTDLDKVLSYLSPLEARYGRFIVMGNNDYSHFSRTLFNRYLGLLRGMGWIPLLNESVYLSDLSLWIIGIDDPATAHDDVSKAYATLKAETLEAPKKNLAPPPFRLALAHSSDCLDDVVKYGADLLLTGHTHGGQIRLPGLKPFITNTYLGDEGIYEGYHVIDEVPLYINRGLGESEIPLRLNVPPEITFFTLHKGDSEARHTIR